MKNLIATLTMIAAIIYVSNFSSVYALTNSEVLNSINIERQKEGLSPLVSNTKLEGAARMKLADMKKYAYWSHDNPITNEKWWKFIDQSGFAGLAGENLSKNFYTSEDVIRAWMNSTLHKKNVLEKNYVEIGISIGEVEYFGKSELVVVAEFVGKQDNQVVKLIKNMLGEKTI